MDDIASRTVLSFPAGTPTGRPPSPPPEPLWRELVGQVLRSERIETRRTLQQVAERAGVSPQYLSEVERGRKDPSSEMLESICGALGLRLADLLAASGQVLRCTAPVGLPAAADHLRTGIGSPTGVVLLAA
jgi:DNA-binding XRE family transcriptional regulator